MSQFSSADLGSADRESNGPHGRTPIGMILGLRTKLNSLWLQSTYPFAQFGRGVSVHYSCDIDRSKSPEIRFGNDVYLAPDVWLDVVPSAPEPETAEAKIIIGDGCQIGRRSTISARNRIILEADVLMAPSILIMDHNHEFSNIGKPDVASGAPASSNGGTVFIGRNCWLGIGVVIASGSNDLHIGRNSVVAANAVVTQSFPPFSLVAGNPARIIKTFDQETGKWVRAK